MLDTFDSPRELLIGARDHINNLDAMIKSFFDRKPYANVVDFDSKTNQYVHKVRITAKIPGSAARIAKYAFSDLRDALDHAVYASTVSLRIGRAPERTGFPFAENAVMVHDKMNRQLIDVPPAIRTLLEGLMPHKTGNQLLWGLNRTRNIKTHRVLVPFGVASMSSGINFSGDGYLHNASFGTRWDASKNEVEYLRLGRQSNMKYDANISFDVIFGEVEVFGGEPAIATLNAVFCEVEGIVLAIEAETDRLLRSPL